MPSFHILCDQKLTIIFIVFEYIFFKAAGRWTQEEHELFLKGLQIYNKQWKLIADMIKTRTVVQIRTHAQKYFQRLQKMDIQNLSK